MNLSIRRDPFTALEPVFQADKLFDALFGAAPSVADGDAWLAPRWDIHEQDDAFVITAEVPGISREDIQLSLEDGVLTLKAETANARESEEKTEAGVRVLRRERRASRYLRRLNVGDAVDEAGISASLRDGVLSITLPKRVAVKPEARRIAVH